MSNEKQDYQFMNDLMHKRAPLQPLNTEFYDDFSNVRVIFQGGNSQLPYVLEQSTESIFDQSKQQPAQGKIQRSFKKSAEKLQQSQFKNFVIQTTNKENLSPIEHLSAIKLQLFQGQDISQGLASTTTSNRNIAVRNLILSDISSTLNSQVTNDNIKITSYYASGGPQQQIVNSKEQTTQNKQVTLNDQGSMIKKNKSQGSLKESLVSQKAQLSPLEIIQQNLQLPDITSILLEGSILKYKPGMSSQYCDRYMILSKQAIAVFPTKWQAKIPRNDQSHLKTTMKIPIQAIQTCQRVKVQLSGKGGEQFFQFEIFLKEEYQDELMNMESQNMKKVQQNHQDQSNLISARTYESQEFSVNQMHSPSNAEYLKRSIPSEMPSQSKQGTTSKHRRSGSNLSNIIHQNMNCKQRSSIVSSVQLESMRQSMVAQNKQQMDEIVEKNLKEPQITYGIMVKNPSSWISSFNNHQTWTHREIEWYCGSKRLLFACHKEEECGLWVLALNMVINHHLQSITRNNF